MCENASQVIVCQHIVKGQKPDVLLCEDDGTIETAACFECADRIDAGGIPAMVCYCRDCFQEATRIPSMPVGGFWIIGTDGQYRPQSVN